MYKNMSLIETVQKKRKAPDPRWAGFLGTTVQERKQRRIEACFLKLKIRFDFNIATFLFLSSRVLMALLSVTCTTKKKKKKPLFSIHYNF